MLRDFWNFDLVISVIARVRSTYGNVYIWEEGKFLYHKCQNTRPIIFETRTSPPSRLTTEKCLQVLGFLTPSTTLQLQSTSNSSIKLPLGAVVTYTCSRYDLLKQDRGDNLRYHHNSYYICENVLFCCVGVLAFM